MSPFPPTVVVIHRRENPKKCSVAALEGRAGFVFWRYPMPERPPLEGYVQLGMEGPLLSAEDAPRGLLVLDATWRLAERMHKARFSDVPMRTLPEWTTAYPRVSKNFADPRAGLATIEAIFIAFQILGRDTRGLLDHYHWADRFLSLNAERLRANASHPSYPAVPAASALEERLPDILQPPRSTGSTFV